MSFMQNDNIKISVLMPVYNASNYISEAIESVLKQTFSDFELLIIDDGSTDNTAEIVRNFKDPRIVFIQQQNAGIAIALNNGLKFTRAEYIARFDADDICYANRLETQYEFMINNPVYVVVGSDVDYVDVDGNFIFSHQAPAYTNTQIKNLPYSVCPFIHSSVLFKKSIIPDAGYNVHAHTFEDHFLWLQIMSQGKFHNLSQSLMQVRLNPQSLTIDEKWRPKEFISIKYKALEKLNISPYDGEILLTILKKQDNRKIKTGSYQALLAKKFLWNNYQPLQARRNIKKAILLNPFHLDNYLVLGMSFLPRNVISKIYSTVKTKYNFHNSEQDLISEKQLQY
ncbi:MAG TPA: glycosyltransferase [Puia sp.]|jgi:glycosyltransferase involved in cell wall biosynthesis|nr:glycosyltransferase [Puia sp.]